jgi:signal transduction histidine kinase
MLNDHSHRFFQLTAIKNEVITQWLTQVKKHIPYASSMQLPTLINTLPDFYEYLIVTILGEEGNFGHSKIAAEHGSQRAHVTRFDAESIVHEFQLFRSVIIDAWHANGIMLQLDEVGRLNNEIDDALRESLAGFSKSQAQIREQFFSALTHDLRTPLAAASAAASIIHKANDVVYMRRMAEIAMRQHTMLATMTSDLLDMMVLNSGSNMQDVTDTALCELVGEAVTSVSLSSSREIRFCGNQIQGFWYAVAIRRAVENLLNNAVKYSSKDTPIEVSITKKDGYATIAVTNLGPPFQRTKRKQSSNYLDVYVWMKRKASRAGGLAYLTSVRLQRSMGEVLL